MNTIVKKVTKYSGIDSAIGWSIINKVWLLFKGFFSLYFIVRYLSSEQQGIWYTFPSLGTLTMFAELGFTIIITQFVSHEYSKLSFNKGIIEGDRYDLDKLFSLIRYAIKFYLIIIPIAVIILSVVGYNFFHNQSINVLTAWFIFSIIGGCSLFNSLLQSIYQGFDRVKDIQQNIFIGSFLTTSLNWVLLYYRFHIWALVYSNGFGLLVMMFFLYKKVPSFWKQLYHYEILRKYSWFKEIITLQWKYAITWASGYFVFFLFTPAAYKFQGSVVAGQLGITLTLIGVISGISESWIGTKIPKFNILVAKNKNKELMDLFIKSSIQSFVIFIIGAFCLLFFIYMFSYVHFFQNRFLDLKLTAYLLLSNLPLKIIIYLAIYLRSHKIEPFYILSAVNGALIAFCVLVIYPKYGLFQLFICTNIVYWLIVLPFAIHIFRIFQKSQMEKIIYE